MNMLKRHYELKKLLKPGKVLILYGPRQVGKTTLVEDFLDNTKLKYKYDTGDSLKVSEIFGSRDVDKILEYAHGYELIVIDEAQKIDGIGLGLKILIDARKDLRVLVTGSSSFELAQNLGEPLTGRKRTHILYPLSQLELLDKYNRSELQDKLEEFLVYGTYPEVLMQNNLKDKQDAIEEISDSYLLKDVLKIEQVKKPVQLVKLLKLLAFQVGGEVSLHELGTKVQLDQRTVENYIDILEKAFVIKYVGAYSNNLRSEITSKGKVYFYDTGVRNAIINNYNPLDTRDDVGALWENFLFVERLKKREYERIYANYYFWRTYDQKEIDLVEERDGKLYGYEFKWGNKRVKEPKLWKETYSNAQYEVINRENYLEFIT